MEDQDSNSDGKADAGSGECRDHQCLEEGGQVWLEHVEYSPTLVSDGEPAKQLRLGAFFFREPVPMNPGGVWCFDMVNDPRSPIALDESREYLDVGEVTISGGGSSFVLNRVAGGIDYLHRSSHDLFYEVVAPEEPEQALVGGIDYSISFGGAGDVEAMERVDVVRMPKPIAPGGPALEDLELQRGEAAVIQLSTEDSAFNPHVMLLRSDGTVVVFCSGEQAAGEVTLTPEALDAFLLHEASGEGRLLKMATGHSGFSSSDVAAVLLWANWATVQKFAIID